MKKLTLNDLVSRLVRSGKAKTALERLRVATVEDLLALDIKAVRALSGYGAGTAREIASAQKRALGRVKKSPGGEAIVVSEMPQADRRFEEAMTSLPARARRAVELLGIRTLPEFLGLTGGRALSLVGIGAGTWRDIRRVQRVFGSQPKMPPPAYKLAQRLDTEEKLPFNLLFMQLSRRTKKVLRALGIRDGKAMRGLAMGDVLRLRGAGVGTWRELRIAIERLEPGKTDAMSPATELENAVFSTPLFSEMIQPMRPGDLPPRLFSKDPIETFDLPVRASNCLGELGLRTIGELLCTRCQTFLETRNFGVFSLSAVQSAVLEHLRRRNGLLPEQPLDLSTWKGFVKDLLARSIQKDHLRTLVVMRRGLLGGTPATLKEVGQQLGVTRERIRQLELIANRRLRHKFVRQLASPFLSVVDDLVKEAGGRISCEALAPQVAVRLNWSKSPSGTGVAGLLEALTGSKAQGSGYVTAESPCRSCSVARGYLLRLLGDRDEIPLDEAKAAVTACCKKQCPRGVALLKQPSDLFVSHLLGEDEGEPQGQVVTGAVYSPAAWQRHEAMVKLEQDRLRRQQNQRRIRITKESQRESGRRMRSKLLRGHAHIVEQCRILRTLASKRRLTILHLLRRGPRLFTELAAATGMSVPALSYHVSILRSLGLLNHQQYGTFSKYGLDRGRAKELARIIGDGK